VRLDGRLHDVTVPELVVPKCSACGELVFSNDTDEQINRALRTQLGLLQPDEIRAKRVRLRLTQRALAGHIGVAAETLSRWESGLLIQGRAMNTLLRLYFDSADARAMLGGDSAADLTGWASITWPAITDVFIDPASSRALYEQWPTAVTFVEDQHPATVGTSCSGMAA
jgi:putative zinc finger/helix-turn-helix YgiT family protein